MARSEIDHRVHGFTIRQAATKKEGGDGGGLKHEVAPPIELDLLYRGRSSMVGERSLSGGHVAVRSTKEEGPPLFLGAGAAARFSTAVRTSPDATWEEIDRGLEHAWAALSFTTSFHGDVLARFLFLV